LPAEALWSDACRGADVGLVAALDELEAEVDVFLLVERQTTQDETTSVEASNCSRDVSANNNFPKYGANGVRLTVRRNKVELILALAIISG